MTTKKTKDTAKVVSFFYCPFGQKRRVNDIYS